MVAVDSAFEEPLADKGLQLAMGVAFIAPEQAGKLESAGRAVTEDGDIDAALAGGEGDTEGAKDFLDKEIGEGGKLVFGEVAEIRPEAGEFLRGKALGGGLHAPNIAHLFCFVWDWG